MPTFTDRNSLKPRARKRQLLVESAGDGLVIYDLDRHNAHTLNAAAAAIWKSCNGRRSVGEIGSRLNGDFAPEARAMVVRQALADLERRRLLDNRGFSDARMSRRNMVKKLGIGAAVAIALPAISSIVAPTTASALSCRTLGLQCTDRNGNHPCCANTAGTDFCKTPGSVGTCTA